MNRTSRVGLRRVSRWFRWGGRRRRRNSRSIFISRMLRGKGSGNFSSLRRLSRRSFYPKGITKGLLNLSKIPIRTKLKARLRMMYREIDYSIRRRWMNTTLRKVSNSTNSAQTNYSNKTNPKTNNSNMNNINSKTKAINPDNKTVLTTNPTIPTNFVHPSPHQTSCSNLTFTKAISRRLHIKRILLVRIRWNIHSRRI
jgi:hypothetical protein